MSISDIGRQATALFAGRWQIPVALVAALAGGVSLYRMLPTDTPPDFDSLLADVDLLEQSGATTAAADVLANLLTTEPPLPADQRAVLHDRLAGLIFQRESERVIHNAENLRLVLEHHATAMRLGCEPSATRSLRGAQVAEWLDDSDTALPAYRSVLEQQPSAEERRQALQGLVRLMEGDARASAECQRLLDELLADEGVSPGYLWWALRQSLKLALDENDTVRARLLLSKYGNRLKTSDLKGYADYLWALVLLHEGRPEEAEPLVHWIDNWLDKGGPDTGELDEFGHLPALNRWLLGQIHLAEHQPQAALESFRTAVLLHPFGDLYVAATAGQVRALADLERHSEARELLREAVSGIADTLEGQQQGLARLQGLILELVTQREACQDWAGAADYLSLAVEFTSADQTARYLDLLERQGQDHLQAATIVPAAEQQRMHWGQAGNCFEQVAEVVHLDDARSAALWWSAAQAYDQAGRISAARRVLKRFLVGRSTDARLPRAYLRMGQACEADGLFEEALDWYARLGREFPMLEEAYRGAVHSSGCLRALGRYAEAETTLQAVLEDDNLAPPAQEYHDALLELCGLLYEQGRFADAISRLEEFTTRYPDDPAGYHSWFMLADAYRRSAYLLREQAQSGSEDIAAAEVARERFGRAARLFDRFLLALVREPERDEALDLYDRLALFYYGDCLFEMNQPETLREALEVYRRAAVRYEHEPAALTAQVQVANIYVRMGMLKEAARAVERARWLLRNIPDNAFDGTADNMNREQWDRYLTAISSSDLFRRVFAGTGG
ncbi:MAG: tetratricopeptide repeat protein [Planctomycetota bacterium]